MRVSARPRSRLALDKLPVVDLDKEGSLAIDVAKLGTFQKIALRSKQSVIIVVMPATSPVIVLTVKIVVEGQRHVMAVARLATSRVIAPTRPTMMQTKITRMSKPTKSVSSVVAKVILQGIAAPGIPTCHPATAVATPVTLPVIALRHPTSATGAMKRDILPGIVLTQARSPVTNVERRATLPAIVRQQMSKIVNC